MNTTTITHRAADGTYTATIQRDGNFQSITRIIHPDGAIFYRDGQAVKLRGVTHKPVTVHDFARETHPEYAFPSDFMAAIWDSYTARVYVDA